MKTFTFILIALFSCVALFAQTPQSFRYQAVARDNSGNVLANQDVSFRISILSENAVGTAVYSETHAGKTTNAFGLVELEIGKGTPVTGTFSGINWGSNSYFVKIEMDPSGNSAYQTLNTSQMLSVPYALFSEKAGNAFSGDYNDLTNKPLLFDGAWNSLTGKPATLSGYGITDGINTSHPANGIISGMITNWNTAYNWGNHAGLYKPLSYQPLWTEITSVPAGFADGIDNVNDADNSITNEIQVLSLTGNALSLSKEGGTVTIPGDNWGTQVVVTDATLTGNGTATAPLQIARQTAIAGQVLKWNGSAWMPADDDTSSVLKLALPYTGRAAGENFLFNIINEGQGNGIRGETISGTGLLGLASATAAMNIGTAGQSASSSGVGIWGNNIALTGNGIAVKGSVQSPTGYSGFFERGQFYIEGNVGIGTLNPSAKLEIAGQVKITGGSPAAGKVLTSDEGGLASWQEPEKCRWLYVGFTQDGKHNIAYSAGNVGIGTIAPSALFEVQGTFRYNYGNVGNGKVLTSDNNGFASWQTPPEGFSLPYERTVSYSDYLMQLTNSGTGSGLAFTVNATTGTQTGIYGESKADQGTGVRGFASSASGSNHGVMGATNSTSGVAVYGQANATTGAPVGIKGWSFSSDGYSGYFLGGKFYISGNTGVGTTNPSARLEVAGQVKITGGSPGNGKVLVSDDNGLASWQSPSISQWITSGSHIYYNSGNVGIGTNSPAAKLDVSTTTGPNLIIRDSNGSNDRPGIQFVNNNIHFISGDDGSEEIFGIYSGYGNNRTYAARLNVHGPAVGNWGKYISLTHDGNHGRISTDAGYLTLEPAGQRVGIGTDAPTQNLDVNGNARIRSIGSAAYTGPVNRTADGTLTTATSDIRLKENIRTLQGGLDKVMQLRGVSFTWKSNPRCGTRIGFIAQEVEKILPELVFTNETDGYKGVNYAEMSAVLVEAIKQLKAENERLKNENREIKAENLELKASDKAVNSRLERLEQLIGVAAENKK